MEGVLSTDKEIVPLEIPYLDVIATLEDFLCRALALLMIFPWSTTGVAGGLS